MHTAKAEISALDFRSILLAIVFLAFLSIAGFGQSPKTAQSVSYLDPLPQDTGSAGLKQELRKLQTTGRLMMVTAHPDDEDGGLLTLESRGKGVQTLLLTLTRGEGGQNKTGDTFSDELGVLRTLELLAADRYYGVEQRFTRVADFGYSKTPEETFQKWGGHDVPLADMVRVIREFRPDVLIARFSGTDRDGHGHHQASAILTKEAFRAAADPNRFPEQIKEGLQPWQPKKLYIGNVCGFGASTCPDENYTVKLNTGEQDPVLGMSYFQFAIEGLRHQESQGLGDLKFPSGPRFAFYQLVDSVLPNTKDAGGHERDFFDGIDTSVAGLADTISTTSAEKIRQAAAKIADAEKIADSDSQSAAPLLLSALDSLQRHAGIQASNPDTATALVKVKEIQQQSRAAINLALNIQLTASMIAPRSDGDVKEITAISPGQSFAIKVALHNGSHYPLHLDSLMVDGRVTDQDPAEEELWGPSVVSPNQTHEYTFHLHLPEASFTKPGFHRNDPQRESVYTVDAPQLITLPFATTPPISVYASYNLHALVSAKALVQAMPASASEISAPVTISVIDEKGKGRPEEIAVVPAFSVAIEPGDQVVPASSHEPVAINVRASSNLEGLQTSTLRLRAPANSKISPPEQQVSFSHRGEKKTLQFKVALPAQNQGHAELRAVLSSGGKFFSESYTLVTREDLGSFYYFQPAVQHISIVDVKVPKDLKVGYIMGAGDDIPTVLQQIGMNAALVPAEKLATENLAQYKTIVLGVRAYDTQKELVANNQKLLDFVSNGGTLIVQNNNSTGDFNSGHLTPYPAELSRARVSVEDAPVQILASDDPVFHYPNEISQKDFDGWVQERGLYFMDKWDDHFKPLLSCHDPNEPDQKGGLLIAKYGKGTYIYTGYAFFRQLPAGVPGAIRLFVNLVSAGSGH